MSRFVLPALLLTACSHGQAEPRAARLAEAQSWMYQIQDLDADGAVEALAASSFPMLVLEPGHNLREAPYDTRALVDALRTTPDGERRLLLAYIDIGQAERYRSYWGADWRPPTSGSRGEPQFILAADPDGWSDNFTVAYWHPAWQALWLGEQGIVAELARFGFDGIYLDWVEAYDDDSVVAAAESESVDPTEAMVRFVEALAESGRAVRHDFLVVPQNAPYLIDHDRDRYASAIDALAVEDTWFHGYGDADWNSPDAGDKRERHQGAWSTESRLAQYRRYQDTGLPVFSVDYCIDAANAARVYREARGAGLRPLVTRVSLSRMTETPP